MITNLYDLIEHWDTVKERIREGEPRESISDVEIRAPLVGRDILAVAKNYRDHVK
jgi:2-keto-4-pentenoate hydratase/2-oxohepta-3-ene-1,7-dioic acid hydratase in catechol pathway